MKSSLTKKAGMIAFGTILISTVLGTTVFASQTVKIVVNGKQILSDVTPQIVNGRVLVPISFVARALGANVDWNGSTKTVTVETKSDPTTDAFNQEITSIDEAYYIYARNAVTTFIAKHDSRDQTGRDMVTEDYDSDVPGYTSDVIIPIGGYPTTIDYDVVDAKFDYENSVWVIRLTMYEWHTVAQEQGVQKMTVDFHVAAHNKIKGAWLVGEPEIMDQHTVFPGLTVNKR